jgi:non-ribosomal peptide synthetase component E (peptide arylation enzyme)
MTEWIWLQHYDKGFPMTLKPYPSQTLLDYLSEAALKWPDRTALLFKGSEISYHQLQDDADALSAALVAIGVRPGDRV